jgi:hypothetical protein
VAVSGVAADELTLLFWVTLALEGLRLLTAGPVPSPESTTICSWRCLLLAFPGSCSSSRATGAAALPPPPVVLVLSPGAAAGGEAAPKSRVELLWVTPETVVGAGSGRPPGGGHQSCGAGARLV